MSCPGWGRSQRQSLEKALLAEKYDATTVVTMAKLGFCDFGMRGVEMLDAASVGGMAALTQAAAPVLCAGLASLDACVDHITATFTLSS